MDYLDEILNMYSATPHFVTQFTTCYLLDKLKYDTLLPYTNYYLSVDAAKKITVTYQKKNKVQYDAIFLSVKFNIGDTVMNK